LALDISKTKQHNVSYHKTPKLLKF